uniref:Uncharacterized protein n=1 Tax=Kalanchoe fedtschenkoi TaxID=63787 RepID=A0A7N0TZP1_KALFE
MIIVAPPKAENKRVPSDGSDGDAYHRSACRYIAVTCRNKYRISKTFAKHINIVKIYSFFWWLARDAQF